jgi:hypothetical protein
MVGFLWGPPGYSMDQWLYPFYHSAGEPELRVDRRPGAGRLLVAQRAETNPDAQRDLWMQIWDHVHDMVYQAWWPGAVPRPRGRTTC